jgi:molybdopterin biosynthesis enzyme MoaB
MDRQRKELLLQASGGNGHVSISSSIRGVTDDATTKNLNDRLRDVSHNLKTSSKVYDDDNDKLDAKETLKKIE